MEILKEFEEMSATPVAKLQQIADDMVIEMRKGLASDSDSTLKMLISYIAENGLVVKKFPENDFEVLTVQEKHPST
ncbi:hexokinase [Tanacetum coccineum]